MYPVYAGQFEIRAVAFANKTNLNAWLKARKANGYVEDANAGERYVTAYSDWTTIKVTSEEEGLAVARWQKQLDLALKNKKVTNILFTTDAEKTFTLKEGRYLYKTITIDAPNADIVNEARFQQINVEQIKGSTFFEKAVGNRFHITAPNASFHVAKGAEVSKLVFQPKNITVTVEETAEGATIDTQVKLELNVNASVSLSVGAQAAETVVNILKSVIATLTGAANNVQVNVDKAAEGATIQSETKVTVNTNANIKVELAAGAEGTEVKTGEGVKVEVKNDTTTNVTITDNNGNTSNVGQGEETTTTPAPTPTTPPSSGGSTGGSTPTPTPTPETTLTVTVDKETVEVEVGKTDTVTATVEGASEKATYEWTASPAENVTLTNAYTATVTVEGKVAGEVTLTVKVTDGEKTGTATVTVTVKESTGEEPSTTVKVEVKSASGTALTSVNIPTGSSVALTVEITSNDGALDLTDPTIEWTATEGVTVTPTTGESVTVKAEQDGTITVTVILKNGIKIVNTITVKVQ